MGLGNGFDSPELVPANSAGRSVFAPDGERVDCAPGLTDLTLSPASVLLTDGSISHGATPLPARGGGIRRPWSLESPRSLRVHWP